MVEEIGINEKEGSERDREIITLTDAADAIMVEFVESFGDQETSRSTFRRERPR